MPRRRGYMLLLAIVLIGAIGLTLALIGRHFIGMTRATRFSDLDVRAAQLVASGQDWIEFHPDQCADLQGDQTISLDLADLLPPGAEGRLILSRNGSDDLLMIAASVRRGRQASTMKVPYAPAPAP